jgi:hypothetical protein
MRPNELADKIRLIEKQLAEVRQDAVKYGTGVADPYGLLYIAGELVLKAVEKARSITEEN